MTPLSLSSPFPPYHRPDPTILDVIANYLLVGAVLGALVFAVAYFLLFRWYETAAGRQVLALVASLLLVLGLAALARLTGGDYPLRAELRLLSYLLVAVASWGLVVVLAAAWIRGGPALDLRERESMKRTPTRETPTMTNATPAPAGFEPVDERVLNTVEIARLGDGSTLNATNVGIPTQVANPGRTTLRTIAAVLTGIVLALPVVNAALAIIQSELLASGVELPAWLWAAVNGAIAVVAIVSGIVTRVLAIPGVNAWLAAHAVTRPLTAIPLQPAHALDREPEPDKDPIY